MLNRPSVATGEANTAPRLWYGTSDAPAPDGVEIGRSGATVVIGVAPASPTSAVTVRYRVDGGPVQLLRAIRGRVDFERGAQYFRATFPTFWSGSLVEYNPILSIAGRPIGDPALATSFPASFRLADPVRNVGSPRPGSGPQGFSAGQPSSRHPFTLDYLASANVPLQAQPEIIGPTPEGFKMNWYPAPGGVVVGPGLRADVGVEGEHGMTVRPDGVGIVGVIASLTTDDGARVMVSYSGVLDLGPGSYRILVRGDFAGLPWPASLRTAPLILTAHPKYLWLNRLQYLAIGELNPASLNYSFDLYAVR